MQIDTKFLYLFYIYFAFISNLTKERALSSLTTFVKYNSCAFYTNMKRKMKIPYINELSVSIICFSKVKNYVFFFNLKKKNITKKKNFNVIPTNKYMLNYNFEYNNKKYYSFKKQIDTYKCKNFLKNSILYSCLFLFSCLHFILPIHSFISNGINHSSSSCPLSFIYKYPFHYLYISRLNKYHYCSITKCYGACQYLLNRRAIIFNKYLDEKASGEIINLLLSLVKQNSHLPITLFFSSSGTSPNALLSLYKTIDQLFTFTKEKKKSRNVIENIKEKKHEEQDEENVEGSNEARRSCKLITVNIGLVAGGGAIINASGSYGERYAYKNSNFLIQLKGYTEDLNLKKYKKSFLNFHNKIKCNVSMKYKIMKYLFEKTNKNKIEEKLSKYKNHSFYLNAEEAKECELIDHIIEYKK